MEWCTRDPAYSDHGGVVGLRWDSLHADNESGRITYKTLHKIMRDAGQGDHIPQPPAPDDFDDLDPEDLPEGAMTAEKKPKPKIRTGEGRLIEMTAAAKKALWTCRGLMPLL